MPGTMAGRAFTTGQPVTSARDGSVRVWVPVVEQTTRTGVLAITVPEASDTVLAQAKMLGVFAGLVVAATARVTDIPYVRRRGRAMSLPASMQWDLLPPLSAHTAGALIAGVLEPAYDIAGDAFDYAVNGADLHFGWLPSAPGEWGVNGLLEVPVTLGRVRRRRGRGLLTTAQRESASGGHDATAAGQDGLMRYVELRRHTDNDGNRLTPHGAAEAEVIGRDRLHPPCAAFVSTDVARATQMLEILRHATGQDDLPITLATALRSSVEDRWRDAAKAAGKGADLDDIRAIDAGLIRQESVGLASALRQVIDGLPEGGGRWWWATAPPTRPPCSGSPAGSSRHWARAKECC